MLLTIIIIVAVWFLVGLILALAIGRVASALNEERNAVTFESARERETA